MAAPAINTHGMICDFGRHRGEPYTRLPVSYLTWMVGSGHSRADIAQAELERRGTTTPEIDISGHAVDRISQHSLTVWKENRRHGKEGLHSWLVRVAQEAIAANCTDTKGRYLHLGLRFAFEMEGRWPVLKTVLPGKRR